MWGFNSFDDGRQVPSGSGLALLALACIAVFLSVTFNPGIFNDGDTSWHLAAGQLILDRYAVPATDPFSFTFAGEPWHAHEWLAEVVIAATFAAGGWSALALLTGIALAATLFIIAIEAARHLKPVPALAVVTIVAAVLLPFVLARPHVLAWPLLATWVTLLLRARERRGAPGLAAALLMLLWANVHASFLLGLLFVGFFAVEAMIYERDRIAQLKAWAPFALASLATALVTPHGFNGFLYPLQVSSMQSLPLIAEWRSTNFGESLAFAVMLAAVAAILLIRWKQIPASRMILLAVLAYLSIEHVRHQSVLAIAGSLIVVRAFGPGAKAAGRLSRATSALLLAIVIAGSIWRLATPAHRPDSESNPLTAISHIPSELRSQPVMNSYAFGGPLILNGIRPFIDGRGDMYGDAFMFAHRRMMDGDMEAFAHAAKRWGIRWTILSPLDPLSRKLDEAPGWRRAYADRWAVIHVAR